MWHGDEVGPLLASSIKRHDENICAALPRGCLMREWTYRLAQHDTGTRGSAFAQRSAYSDAAARKRRSTEQTTARRACTAKSAPSELP